MEYMRILRTLTGFLSEGWSLALFPSSRNESEPHAEYQATAIYRHFTGRVVKSLIDQPTITSNISVFLVIFFSVSLSIYLFSLSLFLFLSFSVSLSFFSFSFSFLFCLIVILLKICVKGNTEERSKLRSDAVAVIYLRQRNRRNICCMKRVNSWSALCNREINNLYLAVNAKKCLRFFRSGHTNNSLILSIFISFLVYGTWYFVVRLQRTFWTQIQLNFFIHLSVEF